MIKNILSYLSIVAISALSDTGTKANVLQMLLLIFIEYGFLFFLCFNEFTYLGLFGIYSAFVAIIFFDYSIYIKGKLLTYTLVFNFLIRVITKCMFCYMIYLMTIKKFGLYPDLPWHI